MSITVLSENCYDSMILTSEAFICSYSTAGLCSFYGGSPAEPIDRLKMELQQASGEYWVEILWVCFFMEQGPRN